MSDDDFSKQQKNAEVDLALLGETHKSIVIN